MKKALTVISILFVGFVAFQGTASAKLVLGKVESVDATAKTLSVNTPDATTGTEKKVSISIPETATFSGVSSLDQIKSGDEVWVEAEEDAATGGWKATSVQVTTEVKPAAPAAPVAEAPAAKTTAPKS